MIKITYIWQQKPTIILLWAALGLVALIITFLLVLLILNSSTKKKKIAILKNLEICQNINLNERLKRINLFTKNNPQYQKMSQVWLKRYQHILNKDYQKIIENYNLIFTLAQNKEYAKNRKLTKSTLIDAIKATNKMKNLSMEVDYFISIDQLIREYQLFFKQNFNYLKDEIVKRNLENQINENKITEIINILEQKFQEIDHYIEEANFSFIIKFLGELGIGVIVLAEILINLPNLQHQLATIIPNKITKLKQQFTLNENLQKLNLSFAHFERQINEKIIAAEKLISHLQYKKANNLTNEVLKLIKNFHFTIQREERLNRLFKTKKSEFVALNLNLQLVYQQINQDLENIKQIKNQLNNQELLEEQEQLIKKQLIKLSKIETELLLVQENNVNNSSSEQLLILLQDLLSNNLVVFNSLWSYNHLLVEEIKPQIMFEIANNKLQSILIQIENLLSQVDYYYLAADFFARFTSLSQQFTKIKQYHQNDSNNNQSELLNDEIIKLQNLVFQLYQEIRIVITFNKLANDALVYANRFREQNHVSEVIFHEIENNLKDQNYEKALEQIISILK